MRQRQCVQQLIYTGITVKTIVHDTIAGLVDEHRKPSYGISLTSEPILARDTWIPATNNRSVTKGS